MGKRKDLLVAVRPTMSVPAGAPMFDCFGAFVAISSGLPSYEGMDFVIPTSIISGSYYATVGRPMLRMAEVWHINPAVRSLFEVLFFGTV